MYYGGKIMGENIESKQKTVLVVDDEIAIVELLKHHLTLEGYGVLEANDGISAVEIATEKRPDLILLDIMLPKLDGLSILKKLRKEGILTPIIMLTAKSQIEDRVLGLDLGADDYLSKPFASEELLARLRSITRRKGNVINENILTYGDIRLNINTPTNTNIYSNTIFILFFPPKEKTPPVLGAFLRGTILVFYLIR